MAPTSAISRIVSSMLAPSLGTNSEQFQQLSEGMSIRPRPTRGLTSCVVDAGSLVPNDAAFTVTYWNNGRTPANKRGKSSSVQTLGSSYVGRMFQVDNEPVLTEEPSSITDTTGTAGGGIGISAQPSCFNAIQALALCQPIPEGSETLKSGTSPQSHAEAKVEIEERGPGYTALREGNTSNEELQVRCPNTDSRSPLASVYDPPLPRKPLAWRVGTDPVSLLARDTVAKSSVRPHPLRTASTHNSNKAVFRYSSESPLQASLYTGSRIPPLFMLVIAVAYNGLEDPQHDFELLQTWLKNHKSGRICFRGISGEEATREKIEEAIRELYGQALHVHGSKLLILFTGEGDNTNRMHLMGGRFITDTDIRNWLWRVRSEARPASVPITVVLDYCRTNKHIPIGSMQDGIEFIWSCSLGQRAAALKFKNPQGMPRSCFLLALMMASYNSVDTKDNLSAAMNGKLHQLSRLLEFAKKYKGDCYEEPQQADWQQAGHMQPIRDLAVILSRMDVVPKVYRVLMNNRWFRETNGLPANWVLRNEQGLLGKTGGFKYKRGTCKPVHACIINPPGQQAETIPRR